MTPTEYFHLVMLAMFLVLVVVALGGAAWEASDVERAFRRAERRRRDRRAKRLARAVRS